MNVQELVPLKDHTTFRIGGLARYFFDVPSLTKLKEAMQFIHEKRLPFFVLGGGSNVLLSDDGYPGVVLHCTVPGVEWEMNGNYGNVIVGAGVYWDAFVEQAVKHEYWGLENLSGIPGTVGGAVVQNLGAYGVEIEQALEWVEVYNTKEGMLREIPARECGFGYRDSIFKHEAGNGLFVTRAKFRLKKNGTPNLAYKDVAEHFMASSRKEPTLAEIRDAILFIRSKKFPDLFTKGAAGSFFKNPVVSAKEAEEFLKKFPDAPHFPAREGRVKLSAGWIIDRLLGLKGMRKGDVGTWEKQALVLVNYGNATAKEMRAFAREIQYRAAVRTNVMLEPEVVFIDG